MMNPLVGADTRMLPSDEVLKKPCKPLFGDAQEKLKKRPMEHTAMKGERNFRVRFKTDIEINRPKGQGLNHCRTQKITWISQN